MKTLADMNRALETSLPLDYLMNVCHSSSTFVIEEHLLLQRI